MARSQVPSARLGFARAVLVVLQYPFAFIAFALLWLSCLFDRVLPFPLPFPRHPGALAKRQKWLVKTLVRAGALPAGALPTRYQVRPFKRGEVFRSSLAEVELDYLADGRRHTFRCVAKFRAQFGSITQQVIAIMQRTALNEIQLYRAHGHGDDPSVLRAYYARAAGLAGRFLLLVERVDPAWQIEEEDGTPIESARAVVELYARFHAAHWRHDPGLPRPRVPVRVPSPSIDFACSLAWGRRRRLSRHFARTSWHYGNRAQTIVHGDARVKNLLFRSRSESGHPSDPIFIDWQATRWGLGAYDLAYFMLVSLTPETRASHEHDLLERYHQTLVRHGVRDYDLDALEDDYGHSVVLVISLLTLPLLGGELNFDEHNREAALEVGIAWRERVLNACATFDPGWVRQQYGVDQADLRATVAWTADNPHPLHRGGRMLAAEVERRRREGIDAP